MTTRAKLWIALTFGLCAASTSACGDDGGSEGGEEVGDTGTSTGDGDTGDGDTGDGDAGDGDTGGTGDTGETGEPDSPCGLSWEVAEMKQNGQTHAAYGVAIAPDGSFAAVGELENASEDAFVAMYDAGGEKLWEQVVDSQNGNDFALEVAIDAAGDVVLVGSLAGVDNKELWIEKRAAADGAVAWTVTEAPAFDGDNAPGGVALAPDGTVVVSGTVRAGDSDSDVWVRKLDPATGAELWTSTYSGQADANGFSIDVGGPVAVAGDGSIYVGAEEGVDFETKEGVLLEFGPDGGPAQWALAPHAGGAHLHDVVAVAGGPEGEAYFVVVKNDGAWGFWLHRASSAGDVEWEMTQEEFLFGVADNYVVAGLDLTEDQGSLTIGGRLSNEEVGQAISWSEVWIANVSLDGAGQCIYAHTFETDHIIPASTYGYGVAEGPNGAVAVGEVVHGPENYLWVGGFR